MIKIATVCSGIGAPEQAIKNLRVPHEQVFACEKDRYARQAFLANNEPGFMIEDMTQCDWIGEKYYSDLFIGGIPCQAFSLAGKRLGELDPRGLLFYDFYRYVKNQQPKVFIIENVKGLLSDNNGNTFKNWLQLLGQSENTHLNMFNHPDSLMYNLHWTVLNSKDFGVPQNRERVFLVGVRNDLPNTFRFPAGFRLTKRLKDILEPEVDQKYYLSDKYLSVLVSHSERHQEKGNGFEFKPTFGEGIATTITTKAGQRTTDNYVYVSEEKRTGEAKAKRHKTRTNDNQGVLVGVTTNDRIAGWFENENVIGAYQDDEKRSSVSEHIYHKETGICNTIQTAHAPKLIQSRIRRLTPLECMRLQGFPDSFIKPCSDSQTYKQAGNSMTVQVMQAIIERLLPVLQIPKVKELNKQLERAS